MTTVSAYIDALPDDRRPAMRKLRATIRKHLPRGFQERLQYRMPSWVVPHSRYPAGYHCSPEEPLPFLSIASQKRHIALYHMGLYADPELMAWFRSSWPEHTDTRLDMGKSCIRFGNPEHIPYDLLGELCGRMTPDDWIARYESGIRP
jgi:uncharacterized protein YdhG (YjbR/CyaY superfamily)